ncbi:hypothetical protein [Bosea sp. TND4EK4]|uniref:hypothetical protein n=1 Tax=Bosea sp. TND4EK4 TaxID=1907408 RepID=UPI0009556E04|nr:hypothetical protein [Bosea sp. TND4EK4]SIQ42823.1 hypothetical protein SAMN05880592_10329 [Bosea sp. TND4EK4]
MANAILAFPRQTTRTDDPAHATEANLALPEPAIPTLQLWRRLPADAFGAAERVALQALIGSARPFGVAHWREALAGDDAAAVAMALRLCGVDVLDTQRHDLVLSMLLWHALNGSAAARTTLAFTLDRRRYLGEDVEALARSWRGPSRTAIHRAQLRALVEALS